MEPWLSVNNTFLGLLFLRDLVMVDPDDRIEVSTVTNYYKHQLKAIDEETKLDDMLEIFKVSLTAFTLLPNSRRVDCGIFTLYVVNSGYLIQSNPQN